jgi:hypothetical protein
MVRLAALAATAIFALSAPAYAQFGMGGGQERDRTRYTEEEKKREIETERIYKEAIKNTRGSNDTYDPWRNIRPATPAETKKQR